MSKELKNVGTYGVIVALVVWLLAVVWQPWGNPLPIWHVVNFIVVVGFIALRVANKDEKEK